MNITKTTSNKQTILKAKVKLVPSLFSVEFTHGCILFASTVGGLLQTSFIIYNVKARCYSFKELLFGLYLRLK